MQQQHKNEAHKLHRSAAFHPPRDGELNRYTGRRANKSCGAPVPFYPLPLEIGYMVWGEL